jgi:hypothetical protein
VRGGGLHWMWMVMEAADMVEVEVRVDALAHGAWGGCASSASTRVKHHACTMVISAKSIRILNNCSE